MDTSKQQSSSAVSMRKAYQSPQLEVYGNLGKLTQATMTASGATDSQNSMHFTTL